MSDSPLTQGPLLRAVLRVALPAAAGHLLMWLNNLVDFLWVNRLMSGREASAGMTQGMTLFWTLASLGQIFSVGIAAVVARRVGEGRPEEAARSAASGLRGALLASVAFALAGWFLIPPLARRNAASPEAAAYAVDYLRTVFCGSPVLLLFYSCEGIFRGHGDTRRPLRALSIALGLNMVLDPLLIHVAGLEVMGAALATVIALGLTAALLWRSAARRGWIAGKGGGIDFHVVGRVVRIGTPVSLHGIVFSLVYVLILHEVNRSGGDAAAAALGLGLRVEGLAYMSSAGCASAAAAIVGQCLGAGDRARAHAGAWAAVRLGVFVAGAWGLILFCLPRAAVDLLSHDDPLVTAYTIDYFEITAVSFAYMAVELILEGGFAGAGDTLPPMLLGMSMTLMRIPAAILLSRTAGMGVAGVFWALTVTSVARGVLFAFWFARGRWVRGRA